MGRGNKSVERLAMEAMAVGDSFLIPEGVSLVEQRRILRPKKFTIATTPEGRRVWRTA
jgi:hypothetical protein